jgi:hypothetical protein
MSNMLDWTKISSVVLVSRPEALARYVSPLFADDPVIAEHLIDLKVFPGFSATLKHRSI